MITEQHPAIYLASASPRRRELLAQIGVRFETLLAGPGEAQVDESVLAGESPEDYVKRLALEKAAAGVSRMGSRGLPSRAVLAADTTVALGPRILVKPAGPADAHAMLELLSGTQHVVLTAVALSLDGRTLHAVSSSEVRFRVLAAAEIRQYVASGEAEDKAGAYAIQGRAAQFITHLAGSYSGVMGLPLQETAALIEKMHE